LQMLFDTMLALFCRHSGMNMIYFERFCKKIVDLFSESVKFDLTL
jgi:hypothetical protein